MSHGLADQQQIHPTPERIAKSTAYDAGDPLNSSEEHRRPARLCTPWDRYAHPGRDGKAVLEAYQILAGNEYARAYHTAGYGRVAVGGYEPAVDGSRLDVSERTLAARAKITAAQRLLRSYEVSLLHTVLFDHRSARDWARATGRYARSGLDYLRDTLTTIAPVWCLAPRKRA